AFGDAGTELADLSFDPDLHFHAVLLIGIENLLAVAGWVRYFVAAPGVNGNATAGADYLEVADERMRLAHESYRDLSGNPGSEAQKHLAGVFDIAREVRVGDRSGHGRHFIACKPAQPVDKMNAGSQGRASAGRSLFHVP